MRTHIAYEVTPQLLTPEAVLTRGRGDCSELADLAVALLRARGIPAQVRRGLLITGRQMVGHAWVAFHDGTGWREIDPTMGRSAIDAHYVEISGLEALVLVVQRRVHAIDLRSHLAAD